MGSHSPAPPLIEQVARGVLVAVGAGDAPEPEAAVKVPRPDVVADLGVLAEAANRVDSILGPARLGADCRQISLKEAPSGSASMPHPMPRSRRRSCGPPVLVIDTRLEGAQLRSPNDRRGNSVSHGQHYRLSREARVAIGIDLPRSM